MSFATVAINVLLLVAMCVPAYILRKLKVINSSAIAPLVSILIFVTQPFVLGRSFLESNFDASLGINILISLGLSAFVTLLFYFVGRVVFIKQTQRDRIMQFASMFGNCGYMGLPLLAALFPSNQTVILYASMYVIVFNILSWTIGLYVLTGDKKYMSIKKGLVNPATIAVAICCPFFFFSVNLPTQILGFVATIGNMTTPISMFIVGIRLAEIKLGTLFTDIKVYLASSLKLLLMPLAMFLMLSLLSVNDPNLFNTFIIVAAMPCAAITVVFSEKFTDDSVSAVKVMLFSTVLSIATIPLMSFLLM